MLTTRWANERAVFAATGLSQPREDIAHLVDLVAAGEIESLLDRRYPMADVVDAHRSVETGRKLGSVAVTVDHEAGT